AAALSTELQGRVHRLSHLGGDRHHLHDGMSMKNRSLRLATATVVLISSACSSSSRPASRPRPSTTAVPRSSASVDIQATLAGWRLPAPRSPSVVAPDGSALLVIAGLDSGRRSTATVLRRDPPTAA